MILVFNTETTGKADFKAPIGANHQPDLVQLGAHDAMADVRACARLYRWIIAQAKPEATP